MKLNLELLAGHRSMDDEKFDLDVWYVDNHSIWLDIKIIFKTLKKVFLRKDISTNQGSIMPTFTKKNDHSNE